MKQFKGRVVSTKMKKTVTVVVESQRVHPIYKKMVKSKKKYHVHDEIGVKVGEMVKIGATRPISKTKKFKIIEVIKL